jgi:hypothetical protein
MQKVIITMPQAVKGNPPCETRLKKLKEQANTKVDPLLRKLVHRAVDACELHCGRMDTFCVKLEILERHIHQALCVQEDPCYKELECSYWLIQQTYAALLPNSVPHTGTVRRSLEQRLKSFPSSYSCYMLKDQIGKMQSDLSRLEAAHERFLKGRAKNKRRPTDATPTESIMIKR